MNGFAFGAYGSRCGMHWRCTPAHGGKDRPYGDGIVTYHAPDKCTAWGTARTAAGSGSTRCPRVGTVRSHAARAAEGEGRRG